MTPHRRIPLCLALALGSLLAEPALAGISYSSLTRTVTIAGTSGADVASFAILDRSSLRATLNGVSQNFAAADVSAVRFYGYGGNDQFTNGTAVRATVDGGDGDDTLRGGSGADAITGNFGNDTLYGGAGNDRLLGSGGSDKLHGELGNDELMGHGGADELRGGEGSDSLNGGSDGDVLYGEAGNDLLMAIGLGTDLLFGGSQWDQIWRDGSDMHNDPTTDEQNLGYLHEVNAFHYVSSPVYYTGLDAVGEELPEPAVRSMHTDAVRVDYAARPLFNVAGPLKEDVQQRGTNDCYFMARLAAMAKMHPDFIRNSVAPLGDGSFVVRFYRNASPHYVRVDADLWTRDGMVVYADPMQSGPIWPAIMEKAYAVAADDLVSYESIDLGEPEDSKLVQKGATSTISTAAITQQMVYDWNAQQQPGGAIKDGVREGIRKLFVWIQARQAAKVALITGSMGGLTNTTKLTATNFRRAQHIYAVDQAVLDAAGQPVMLVLYDPFGRRVELTDLAIIWYMVGRATEIKPYPAG